MMSRVITSIHRNTGQPGRRWRGWLGAAVAALLLAACSTVKLGYNNADTLLVYTVDSYFDLNREQSQLVGTQVQKLLAWHRATQLPAYAQLLADAQRQIEQGPLSADALLAFYGRMTSYLAAAGDQAAPELAQLALTLTPAQIDHFAQKLDKDTSKARRELVRLNGRDTLDDRVKRATERAEDWLGSVSDEQAALIRRTLAARPANQAWWIEERARRQQVLVVLLRKIEAEKPDVATTATWLRAYFAQLELPQDPAQRAQVLEFRRGNAQMMAGVLNLASPEQKAHLLKRLQGYAQDFTALAAAGPRG
jgi:hypothetical protein